MLLTNHAKQRIIKRLSKRRKLERIYSALLDFLKNAERIEVNEKIVIFTDKRKSLVCTKLDAEFLGFNEIMERMEHINETYECVFWGKREVYKSYNTQEILGANSQRQILLLHQQGKESPLHWR